MVGIAIKTLFQDRARFILSTGGVALSIMLVLVLAGMYVGVNRQITAYLDFTQTDVLVAQEGTRNFLGARSLLGSDAERRAGRVPGVGTVIPVISQYVVVDLGDRKEFSLLVGFEAAKGGGPWNLREGRTARESGEVVADYAVARARSLSVGDRVDILGKSFVVVGLSSDTSSWMTGTFFMTFEDATELVATRGRPSYLLVRTEPGATADAVAARLQAVVGDVTVSTRTRVDANDRLLYARILNGPMGFMVLVALFTGAAVVGLTIFTATAERSREYGTLKAIGLRNGHLYLIVLQQALLATVTGTVLGVLLAFGVAWLIPELNPRFMIAIEPGAVALTAAASVLMGSIAALIPARAVAAIDPVVAFRKAT